MGKATDGEEEEAGAEHRQYVEEHEAIDWETIGHGGSSFVPGQGDVINIRCPNMMTSLFASPPLQQRGFCAALEDSDAC